MIKIKGLDVYTKLWVREDRTVMFKNAVFPISEDLYSKWISGSLHTVDLVDDGECVSVVGYLTYEQYASIIIKQALS